jgi:hypothetical protein
MSETLPSEEGALTAVVHRKLAVNLFNSTWDLIDKEARSIVEDDAMINGAHTSLYHWSQIGGPEQLTVGYWQVSHVYTLLQHGPLALHYANLCLDICTTHNLGEWRLAFAHEAIARAYAALNDAENCSRLRTKAIEAGAAISAQGERDHFLSELAKGPWYGIA